MDEKERIRVDAVSPKQDPCSCHICSARNYGGSLVDIYDIKFERHVIRLCQDCAQDLVQKLSGAMDDDKWKEGLLAALLEPSYQNANDHCVKGDCLLRLDAVLDGMPFWLPYACLVKARSGKKPAVAWKYAADKYIGIDPDGLEMATVNRYVSDAMVYLSDPARVRYIATGETDLEAYFGRAHIQWLRTNGILVAADLEYWSDSTMLRRTGATSLLVKQVLDARESLGYLGSRPECRAPWED